MAQKLLILDDDIEITNLLDEFLSSYDYKIQTFNDPLSALAQLENKKDIELIAIGIGHDVSRYYSKAITIMDVDQLGEALLNELSEIFQIN